MKRLEISAIKEPLQALLDVATPDVPLKSVREVYIGQGDLRRNTVLRISYFENSDDDPRKAGVITKEFWLEFPLKDPAAKQAAY